VRQGDVGAESDWRVRLRYTVREVVVQGASAQRAIEALRGGASQGERRRAASVHLVGVRGPRHEEAPAVHVVHGDGGALRAAHGQRPHARPRRAPSLPLSLSPGPWTLVQ